MHFDHVNPLPTLESRPILDEISEDEEPISTEIPIYSQFAHDTAV